LGSLTPQYPEQDDMVEERLPPQEYRTPFANGQTTVLFLNFGGQTLTYTGGWSDSAKNTTHIGSGGTIPPFKGNPQDVLTQVQKFYASFNVKVVSTRPSSGSYEMVVIGGRPSNIGYTKTVFGVSPLDCGDLYHNSVSYVFSDQIIDNGFGSDPKKYAYMVASVAAHESGHMFGLLHTNNTCDLMSYARHQLCPFNHSFQNKLTTLQSDCMGKCSGKTSQNSHQQLMTELGASTGPTTPPVEGPPSVKILAPSTSATVSASFKVDAQVQSSTGVAKVELYVRDKKVAERTAPPYSFQVGNLNPGLAKLDVIAASTGGKTGSASVVVTVKSGTNPPPTTNKPWLSSCLVNSECQSGVCVNGTSGRICTRRCSTDNPCPGAFFCDGGGVCRPGSPQQPSKRPFGTSCAAHDQCSSGICGVDSASGASYCTQLCDLNAPACPGGATCLPAGQQGACGPPASQGSNGAGGQGGVLTGGCSVAGTGAGGSPWLLMGLFLLLVLRRRAG
jgi:MYXO-CTERM domain-containing protein